MRATAMISVLGALLLAGPAQAQQLKPGLWEMQTKVRSDDMDKRLAGMPAEQRAKIEAMMGQRGMAGATGAPGAPGKGMQVCVTPEDVQRPPSGTQERGDCKTEYSGSGKRIPFKTVCTEPPSTSEGEMVFENSETYSMKMHRTTTTKTGPQTMDLEMHAHYVAADCGDVKPRKRPDKK